MPEDLSRHRAAWILFAILLAAAGLYVVPVWWGLPSYTGWAADEAIPWRILTPGTWSPKYPPFHRYLLRALFSAFDGLVDLSGLRGYTVLFVLGRLVSVSMACATVFLVYRCGRLLFDRRASLLAAASVAGIPSLVYYAKTINLDAPYLFWFTASLFFQLKILVKQRLRDYLLFGATAALAVCTKDQAFGLYLATPLVLVAALAMRTEARGVWRRIGAAAVDRRLWLGGLCAAVVFALIHNLLFDPASFLGRFDFIRRAPAAYREFPSTLRGQLGLAVLSGRHLVFLLGVPLALAALSGLLSALRRPRESWRLLTLVAMGIGYYLGFVASIGYHYPRFSLPLGILAGLFCGLGLEGLWQRSRLPRWVPATLTCAIFGLTFARALSVDLLLLNDTRYAVEGWLEEHGRGERRVGYGSRNLLPRGLEVRQWGQLVRDPCGHLESTRPEFIVVPTQGLRKEREEGALRRLESGQFGYDLALREQRSRTLFLLGLHRVESNLDRVSPQTLVFRRTGRGCLDRERLARELDAAAAGTPSQRERLAQVILDSDLDGKLLYGSEDVVGVNLQFGRWTHGSQPAGVAIRNRLDMDVTPWLELGCQPPPEALPITVRIDDGTDSKSYVFTKRGKIRVAAAPAPPGGHRLLLIQADKAWSAREGGRLLGVSVLRVELRPVAPGAASLPRQ